MENKLHKKLSKTVENSWIYFTTSTNSNRQLKTVGVQGGSITELDVSETPCFFYIIIQSRFYYRKNNTENSNIG
jgi:hypothetical protein